MFKSDSYIVISLGDDGTIVSSFKKEKLFKRIFVTSPLSLDFIDLMKELPESPIYLLLDTIDQNYVFSNIPNVGKGNVTKIIKRKIESEFDQNDINTYLFLSKELNDVKKNLKYVFISIRNTSPLKDWVDVINDLPNKFEGIYLIPVEAEDFIKRIRISTHGEQKTVPDEWEVLISYNRVGGFRQIVLKNGKLIFTRISQSATMQSPDAVGKNISQEAANTLEYIRRIGFYDQPISMYIICAKDVNHFIEIPGIKQKDIYIYSPFELAQKLGIAESSQENDKFGDVIFAANFLRAKKKILKLGTPATKLAEKYSLYSKIITYGSWVVIAILPFLSAYFLYSAISTSGKISDIKKTLSKKESELASASNFQKKYGIDPEVLIEAVRVKNAEMTKGAELEDVLKRYKVADKYSNYIEHVAYSKDKFGQSAVEIKVVFDYTGNKNYSEILYSLEKYTSDVKASLKEYQVTFVGIPSEKDIKVDFGAADTKINKLSVTVKITKGKSSAPIQNKKRI